MENFTTRFKNSLKESNLKKTKDILAAIPGESDKVCLDVLHELALVPDEIAWELLLFLSKTTFGTPDIRNRLLQLVMDRSHLNFHFLPIIYRTGDRKKIRESIPLMKHILSKETDTGILMETIQIIGKNKISSLVDDISEYIYFDNHELKVHTVQALERIGSQTALERLKQAAETIKCDQNILDAISALECDPDPEKETVNQKSQIKAELKEELLLFDNLESKELEVRFNAFTKLTEPGNTNVKKLEHYLLSDNSNHDTIINTLGIIKQTIPEQMIGSIYELLAKKRIENTLKFAAYEALEAFPGLDSAASILTGLDSPAPYVHMAAINALDKNATDFVLAEIKNRIETGRDKGETLVETILDVRAKRIIEFLMVSDSFFYIASNYLKKASLSCLTGYIAILMGRGLKSTAKKFNDLLEKKSKENRTKAMVVSSSKTVLAFYEKLLYQKGYAPLTFFSCQDAFERALETKPGIIVSDLFLDGTTVVEFASEIRKLYPQKEPTLVISTLQQDFSGNKLAPLCSRIGVDEIFAFPAKPDQFPSAY